MPVPNGPNSFCSGCGAHWGTHNPSVQPGVPISKSQPFKCHHSSYQLDSKKAMNPQSVDIVPHSSPSARPQWSQFLLQWLRLPQITTQSIVQRFSPYQLKCHQSIVQRFSSYQLDALQHAKQIGTFQMSPVSKPYQLDALQAMNPQSVGLVPHSSPSVRPQFHLQWLRRPPHIMPSLQPGLPLADRNLSNVPVSSAEVFTLLAGCVTVNPQAPSPQWSQWLRRPLGYT